MQRQGQGYSTWDNPSSTDGVQFIQPRQPAQSEESRVGKRLMAMLGSLDLRVNLLARNLVINASPAMQERLIEFAVGIINVLAELDEVRSNAHTRRAKSIRSRKRNL